MIRLFLSALILSLVCLQPAQAQTRASYDSLPEVKKAQSYLQSLTTAEARFIQTDNQGQQLTGRFYLSRPGRMRFTYDPPMTDFIVADGRSIYYYDGALKQQSSAPIGNTLADFFLRPDIRFSNGLVVMDVMRGGDLLQITLAQVKDPAAGSLTLGFTMDKNGLPLEIKKWRVVDAIGAITEVELFELKKGITLDRDLFRYLDPRQQTPRFN